jgi:nucleoid-associated protein YgaU
VAAKGQDIHVEDALAVDEQRVERVVGEAVKAEHSPVDAIEQGSVREHIGPDTPPALRLEGTGSQFHEYIVAPLTAHWRRRCGRHARHSHYQRQRQKDHQARLEY